MSSRRDGLNVCTRCGGWLPQDGAPADDSVDYLATGGECPGHLEHGDVCGAYAGPVRGAWWRREANEPEGQ